MPIRKPATYEDLLKVPDRFVAEILDGKLHVSPRPTLRHAVSASELGADLIGPYSRGRGGPGGWWILYQPELHLEVLRFVSGRWAIVATYADDARVRAEPFQAAEIDLLPLWGEVRAARRRRPTRRRTRR